MQIGSAEVAEILGRCGYDWVAVDMEHGSITLDQLPNIFRALELGNTLPMVRLPNADRTLARQVLDAGAGGVIVPNITDYVQVTELHDTCIYPDQGGKRGVGYCRANCYGENFNPSLELAPLIVGMIENIDAVNRLDYILDAGLDAILIGPYDLSASMGITGNFKHESFVKAISKILHTCDKFDTPVGIHVVEADREELQKRVREGYTFIPYSMDSVMILSA